MPSTLLALMGLLPPFAFSKFSLVGQGVSVSK